MKEYDFNNAKMPKEWRDTVKRYLSGQVDYQENKSSDEWLFKEYLSIRLALVDDSGKCRTNGVVYKAGGKEHCCGKPLSRVAKHKLCEICGKSY